MKRILASLTILILCASASAQKERPRPRITGIAAVQFYSTNISAALSFYTGVMSGGGTPSDVWLWCEKSPIDAKKPVITFPFSMQLNSRQNLTLGKAPKAAPSSLLYEIV